MFLDVGCSKGDFLDKMNRQGNYELHGIDFNKEIGEEVREKGYQVTISLIEDAKLEKNKYDVIRMNHVIEHLYDPVKALNNVAQALKPGGYFIGETPNIGSFEFKIFGKYWGSMATPRHLHIFSRSTIEKILNKVGLKNVVTSPRFTPTGYSGAIQNYLVDKFGLNTSNTGRPSWYVLLLLITVPINIPQYVIGNTGTMGFCAQKPFEH